MKNVLVIATIKLLFLREINYLLDEINILVQAFADIKSKEVQKFNFVLEKVIKHRVKRRECLFLPFHLFSQCF